MRFIDKKSLDRLSFQNLLDRVEPFSPYGKKILVDIKPFIKGQENKLEAEFDKLEKLSLFRQENIGIVEEIEHDLSSLKNIKNLLENGTKNYIFDEVDLFEIKGQAMIVEGLDLKIKDDKLSSYFLKSLEQVIKILDPNDEKIGHFHLYNAYSSELAAIRGEKKVLEQKIFATDDEDAKKILLQERGYILVREEKEEYKVRLSLSEKLKVHLKDFIHNINQLAQLDFAMAKVRFAEQYQCKRPTIIYDKVLVEGTGFVNIRVKEMLENQKKQYTPINISLKAGTTVITGANMGGKSVALSTIVENLLLFHYGFFVAVEEAKLSLMEFIEFVSDDMQDVTQGISSFGAEIYKLKRIYPLLRLKQCFVVFDEFARGTNPQEGQKFVKGLITFLNKFSSISVITSHFDGVIDSKATHYQIVGLKNINLEKLKKKISLGSSSLNVIQEYMDYRLEKIDSQIVPRDALHVAQLIGLDKELEEIIQKEYIQE